MVLVLPEDIWALIILASVLGALGGLAFDVARPLIKGAKIHPLDIDNKLALPRRHPDGVIDLGFVGPIIVGVVAALACVFLFAVDDLIAGDRALAELKDVFWISLVAGFGGAVILEALRGALKKAVEESAKELFRNMLDGRMGPLRELLGKGTSKVAERVKIDPPGADEMAQSVADELQGSIQEMLKERLETPKLKAAAERAAKMQRWVALGSTVVAILFSIGAGSALWGREATHIDAELAADEQPEPQESVATPTAGGAVESPADDETPVVIDVEDGETPTLVSPSPTELVLPDLVLTLTPSGFTVENIGKGDAGPFLVRISDATGTASDFPVDGLPAGEKLFEDLALCSESSFLGIADAVDGVPETNEDNNTAQTQGTIC